MLKFSRDIRENFALIMQIINRPQCSKYFSKDEFVRKIFFIDKILQSFSAFKFGDRRSDRYAPRFTILTLTNKRIYFFSDGKIKFNDLHSLMLRYHKILFSIDRFSCGVGFLSKISSNISSPTSSN